MENQLETRRLKTKDGTIDIGGINKMHNWDSVAFLPQGNKRKAEYWLFGMPHTKVQWEEKKKDVHGQPWHKTSAGKASGARA